MSATPAPSARAVALRLPAVDRDWAYATLLAIALTYIAVQANGGLRVGDTTTIEIVVDIAAGVIAALALLTVSARRADLPTVLAASAFGFFVVFSAISTAWSVAPDQSWLEANRLIAYLAAFGAGMVLARVAPDRWRALLGGITLAAVALSFYAVLHKVFPAWLEPDETYSRLRAPFDYWNAVGLMAALGAPGVLWLGARREGHPVANALAFPAMAVLIVAIMLSYSRGALLALLAGCVFWFALVPLRLRGFAVVAAGAVGAGLIIAWDYSQVALSNDKVPLDLRDQAGHQLGIATLFVLALLLAAGLAVGFARDRWRPNATHRRRAGIAILAALSLIPLAGIAGLSASERGLTGSVSHAWSTLTDPNASQPSNEPGRLTAVGSVRARYWNDALKIFQDRPVLGAGAGGYKLARLRIRTDTLDVQHAHGYVFQVLADRGIVGLVLSLLALAALAWAAVVAIRRRAPGSAERIGLLTLATTIVVFGVHSFVDWTWFIPGVTIPMMLAGGWLAMRASDGASRAPLALREGVRDRTRAFLAVGALVLAGVAAFAAYQPDRALNDTNEALDQLAAGRLGTARELAGNARDADPLDVDPLFAQAAIERKAHNRAGAQRALQDAVRLQPANPSAWTSLAEFQLHELKDPAAAKKTLSAALYLDPKSVQAIQLLLEVNRALPT